MFALAERRDLKAGTSFAPNRSWPRRRSAGCWQTFLDESQGQLPHLTVVFNVALRMATRIAQEVTPKIASLLKEPRNGAYCGETNRPILPVPLVILMHSPTDAHAEPRANLPIQTPKMNSPSSDHVRNWVLSSCKLVPYFCSALFIQLHMPGSLQS